MQVFLELSGHPKANVQRVVLSRTTVVGRSAECGLQIASASVSRKHCELRVGKSNVSVVDLGSSNGTFVDAEKLPPNEERRLPRGAMLNVGGVRFQVTFGEIPAEAPQVAAPAAPVTVEPVSLVASPAETVAPDDRIILDADASPILDGDFLLFDEPEHRPSPSPSGDLVPVESSEVEDRPTSDEFLLDDEHDLTAMFSDEPVAATAPSIETIDPVDAADDEPILDRDEDDAFAFLMDDDPAPVKSQSDSRLGSR